MSITGYSAASDLNLKPFGMLPIIALSCLGPLRPLTPFAQPEIRGAIFELFLRTRGLRIYSDDANAGKTLSVNPRHRVLMDVLDTHGEKLYATLVRLTLHRDVASELLQELFVRLSGNPSFSAAHDPAAYAWRSAINLALEWRRTSGRNARQMSPMSAAAHVPADARSPLDDLEHREQWEQLLDALSDLSDLARDAFVLRFIEEHSYDAVARKLGKTPHQARGLCHAALRHLREKLNPTSAGPEKLDLEKTDV